MDVVDASAMSTGHEAVQAHIELLQPFPDSFQAAVLGQFARIEQALRTVEQDPDTSVHTVRKTLKRLRGLIRLVRDEVGYAAYRSENVVLRDTGRKLAPVRDGFVLVRTLDQLRGEYRALLSPDAFTRTRNHLVMTHDQARRAVLADRALIMDVTVTIKTARARFAAWDARTTNPPTSVLGAAGLVDEFSAVSRGLLRVYRRGRRGMRIAYLAGSPDAFHEWRKRVKYLHYQVDALQPLWPALLKAQAARLDELGEVLGLEHDLALLENIVQHDQIATANQRERTLLLSLIRRARLERQWHARNLGRALYVEKPDAFVARIGGYWLAARGA